MLLFLTLTEAAPPLRWLKVNPCTHTRIYNQTGAHAGVSTLRAHTRTPARTHRPLACQTKDFSEIGPLQRPHSEAVITAPLTPNPGDNDSSGGSPPPSSTISPYIRTVRPHLHRSHKEMNGNTRTHILSTAAQKGLLP